MRKWHKYFLNPSSGKRRYVPIDRSVFEHAESMGGYGADEAYLSKEGFFKKYFFNYQLSRLENYHAFLKKHLGKNEEILSVASGRCANELYLMQEGYRITCSELEILDVYKETKQLFPEFNYIKYDVLSGAPPGKYDAIISLSLIYLFDREKLLRFFNNISNALEKNGRLILDSAGPPNNILVYLIHNIILRGEIELERLIKSISERKFYGLLVKEHGYYRTAGEIVQAAREAGLKLTDQENYGFLNEFARSRFLNYALRQSPVCKRLFNRVGRHIPYIKMFEFKKEA
ncbi:MAG: class I SAM-dependent methyltransferase [Candidatus Omnitrophota bacterium]|nr:MAG: class I SAM-dependent methyltransferase [Candidatus Omnitrophota bacterium]